eukprot:164389_1
MNWVQHDVKHQKYAQKTQEIFNQNKLSSKKMCVIEPEQAKRIVKDEMLKFMTPKTLNIIFDSFKKWKDKNLEDVTAEQMADILYTYPLHNLIEQINDENIDGKQFMKKRHIICDATGWDKNESYQLETIILKHHTFTPQQFKQNMNNIFTSNYTKTLTNEIRNTIEQTILQFDVENIHYNIKNAESIEEFSDCLINIVDDIVQKNNEQEDDMIHTIYEAIAECFIYTEDDMIKLGISDAVEERQHWKCANCGNENVNCFINGKMTKCIDICSLCGIEQKESIILQLRNRPTFVMVNNIDEDDSKYEHKTLDSIDSMIVAVLKHDSFDLVCPNRNDNIKCECIL